MVLLASASTPAAAQQVGVQGGGQPFVLSANGPGSRQAAGLVGVGALINEGGGLVGLDLAVAYGAGEVVDLYLHTNFGIATDGFGILGFVDPGVLVRLTGQRNSAFNAGLKLGPEVLFAVVSSGGAGVFGVAPGLVLSTGAPSFQISAGLDVPMYFGAVVGLGRVSGAGSGFEAAFRPFLGIEAAMSPNVNLYLRVAPLVSPDFGFGFMTLTAGLGF
jgi:hypothetical protein